MSPKGNDESVALDSMEKDIFSPLQIRGLKIRNRIMVSPMCMYSCENEDGLATDFHFVHYSTFAMGGAGIVCAEASAVEPRGRISPEDLGIWSDEHAERLKRVAANIKLYGAVPAIQLAHAGRKAGTYRPWNSSTRGPIGAEKAWVPVAPSAIPFDKNYVVPHELTISEIKDTVELFRKAAVRSLQAGFEIAEIHGAHGYLIHQFLSPASNKRTDEYGGSFENRMRFLLEVIEAVRSVWPSDLPVFLRISATDWLEGAWTVDDSVRLAEVVKEHGIDLIDCSAGAISADVKYPSNLGEQGYQVDLASAVRNRGEIKTAAVGGIREADFANSVIQKGHADVVCIAREFLRDPYWPLHAAESLKQRDRLDYIPMYGYAVKRK